MELLECTATLPKCSAYLIPSNALPHRLGAVGGGAPGTPCNTAWGQWAVKLLQRTATLHVDCLSAQGKWAVEVLKCNASAPWGNGHCNSCDALPHRLGAVGCRTPAMRGPTSRGDGESCGRESRWPKYKTLALQCNNAWGQWVVRLLQCTPTPPGCGGQWNCSDDLCCPPRGGALHCLHVSHVVPHPPLPAPCSLPGDPVSPAPRRSVTQALHSPKT